MHPRQERPSCLVLSAVLHFQSIRRIRGRNLFHSLAVPRHSLHGRWGSLSCTVLQLDVICLVLSSTVLLFKAFHASEAGISAVARDVVYRCSPVLSSLILSSKVCTPKHSIRGRNPRLVLFCLPSCTSKAFDASEAGICSIVLQFQGIRCIGGAAGITACLVLYCICV